MLRDKKDSTSLVTVTGGVYAVIVRVERASKRCVHVRQRPGFSVEHLTVLA